MSQSPSNSGTPSFIRSRRHQDRALPTLNKSLLALAVVALPYAAQAQTAAPEVVEVTGSNARFKVDASANSKFTRPLLDTPQTVQVISSSMLQEQGSNSLMDALRNTPGITMQMGENGNSSAGDTFQMRGFATANSTFVDGLRDMGAVSRDVFNLEQVEVAKGPAGADVGRGAASGYVNLITKQPVRDAATSVTASYGTADNKRVTLDTGINVGDTGAARFNILLADSDVPKRDVVSNQNYSFAPSIAFGLGTSTRYYLLSQHTRQDNTPDGGIPALGRAGYSVIPRYTSGGNTIENAATLALATAINNAPAVDRSNYYGYTGDSEDVSADMVTFRIEHDLTPNTVIRNVTRIGRTDMERVLNGTNSPTVNANTVNPGSALYLDPNDPASWTFGVSRQRIDQLDEIATNQTSFNSNIELGGMNHAITGGLEFMDERRKSLTFTPNAATIDGVSYPAILNPQVSFYSPDPSVVRDDPYATGAFTDGETSTTALYLFDSVEVTPQWLLSAGLRYESYDTTTDNLTLTSNVLTPATLEDDGDLLSWKAGAVYKPSENGSIYVSYATSQTPPGSANFVLSATANNQNNAALDPQETDNAEVGTKWSLFNDQLSLTAAVFRTENSKQASFDDLGQPVQFGRTLVEGVELAAVGQLTRYWQVSAGLTRMDTEVKDQKSSATAAETTGVRWNPDFSATLWTSYTWADLTVGGGVRYFDEQLRNVTASTAPSNGVAAIPSYWVADMMLAYKLSDQANLRVNLNNVTDEEYIETLNNGGNRLRLGMPRSFLVSMDYRF